MHSIGNDNIKVNGNISTTTPTPNRETKEEGDVYLGNEAEEKDGVPVTKKQVTFSFTNDLVFTRFFTSLLVFATNSLPFHPLNLLVKISKKSYSNIFKTSVVKFFQFSIFQKLILKLSRAENFTRLKNRENFLHKT